MHLDRLTWRFQHTPPSPDLGHHGPPFLWDDEARRQFRARLDALSFHLYGLSRKHAADILSTFPIVQRAAESAVGHYRTNDLILAYMKALGAGDTRVGVAL